MPPIPPETFARSLRGLRAPELAAFVSELWTARGWDTAVEGQTVVVTDGETTHRFHIPSRGRLARLLPVRFPRSVAGPERGVGDHDAVVVRSLEGGVIDGARVIDATELRLMALYAIDPGARARLFDRHLGRPATVDTRADRDTLQSFPVPVVASVLLLVVAAALGAAVHGFQSADGPSTAGTAGPSPGSDAPTSAEDPSTGSWPPPTVGSPSGVADDGQYPPGIRAEGIWAVNAIVVSHLIALSSSSHRWTLEYREEVDGRTRGYVRETVWVENDTVYRSRVERVGSVETSPMFISDASTYSDGSVRYLKFDEGETTRYGRHVLWPWGDPGAKDLPSFVDDPIRAMEWYLSVRESRLVDTVERNGTRYHRLAGEGDSWPGTTAVRMTATVDERGVVRKFRRTHQPPDTDVRVVVTFRVSGIGNTTVTPPPWLGAAQRATSNGTAVSG